MQAHNRTYKLISWNQNIRIAHCMYRNRFIFNECISFIINDWKTWYPTVWYISFLLSSIIFLPQLKWPHAHFLLSLFRVLQMKTSSLLQLQLLYVFQTNNSFNMLSNWNTIIIVDLKIYVHKNYMHTFQLNCRIIYLPQLQILVLVYYFLKWRQDLMR